jgi:eukaryotic-like serine/threonine-protein kinase
MMPPVQPGQVLDGKYRIDRVIGVGGMGLVVEAYHLKLDQRVAIKLLLPQMTENADVVSRFAREARAAARIKGDHVARVFDVSNLPDGSPYMVMEFLEGQDLRHILRAHGPFPVQHLADYLLQALEGLAEAHRAGIVHRDLKPANLFLTSGADGPRLIKVLDFGISKLAREVGDQSATSSVAMLGSPVYMSPEQVRQSRAVDQRADIWSVGATMYELATGQRPFPREAIAQTVSAILFDPVVPPSRVKPDIPPAFDAVVVRCLEKDPAHRFADCGELAMALVPFASPDARAMLPRITRWTASTSSRTLRPPEVEALLARGDSATGAPVHSTQTGSRPADTRPQRATGLAVAAGVGFAFGIVVLVGAFYQYALQPRRPTVATAAPAASSIPVAAQASSSSAPAAASTAPPHDTQNAWTTVEPPPAASSAPPVAVSAPVPAAPPPPPPVEPHATTPTPPAPPKVASTPPTLPPKPKPPPATVSGFGPRD